MIHLESRQASYRSVDISVVPMINIVFLLLLYFLIAGQITDADGPTVRLPEGGADKRPAPATLVIHVSEENVISIGGAPADKAVLERQLTIAARQPATHVLVRADARATAGALHKIMAAGNIAQLDSVELATVEAP